MIRNDQRRVKALLDAGRRKYPDFGDTYSALSSIIYPNRGSHLLPLRPVSTPGAEHMASPFTLGFSNHFAKQKIDVWADVALCITRELTSLLAQGLGIPKRGKVMAWVDAGARPGD
jgi:hypothetical protein